MVSVSHIMVGLERMLDYRGVRLARFHCTYVRSLTQSAIFGTYSKIGRLKINLKVDTGSGWKV